MGGQDRGDEIVQVAGARGVSIAVLRDESTRRSAYSLLRSQIDDSSLMGYLPDKDAYLKGVPIGATGATIVGALDAGGAVVGAAYFGPEWTEVLDNAAYRGIAVETTLSIYKAVPVLHGIAVASDARGTGLGRLLLRAVEEYVLRAGALGLAGVTGPHSVAFYERCGYHVLGEDVSLVIRTAAEPGARPSQIGFPITGSSRWFVKSFSDLPAVGGFRSEPDGRLVSFPLEQSGLTAVDVGHGRQQRTAGPLSRAVSRLLRPPPRG